MPVRARNLLFVAPIACAVAVLLGVKEPPRAVAEEPARNATSLGEAFECTAIGDVIKANNGQVPKNGTELVKALAVLGDFAQLPVPFSAVALDSGLTRPRVILAPRPGVLPTLEEPEFVGPPPPKLRHMVNGFPMAQSPLSAAKLTQSHIDGRLFLAANLEGKANADPRVKTIEFISWNTRKKAFDFGVIDCAGEKAEIQILDGVRCFACHKNRGPILGQGPWSNTTHNDVVRLAALQGVLRNRINQVPHDRLIPGAFGSPFIDDRIKRLTTVDGLSLVGGEPEVCDSSIRHGGNLARDREVFKAMTKTGDGRKSLILMMTGIVNPQPILKVDNNLATQLNRTFSPSYSTFANQFVSIHKAMSNTLVDYSPSGSMGSLRTVVTNQPAGWGSGSFQSTDIIIVWGSTFDKVKQYDKLRSEGEHGMPSNRLPSNPRSFVRPPMSPPLRPSAAVSASSLARTLGLTEGDREYMAKRLQELESKINKSKVTTATLANDVFTTPAFVEALKAGNLPDREEFKDMFADALAVVAKANKVEPLAINRGDYASGPSGAVAPGQEYKEPVIVPTTACMRCHDVKGVSKPSAFNPIPMLAFDPFDPTSRDAWVKATKPKDRVAALTRMTKRLVTDQDMPPEDAPEYAKYREKEAASFAAIKEWLEAELKKAKGE